MRITPSFPGNRRHAPAETPDVEEAGYPLLVTPATPRSASRASRFETNPACPGKLGLRNRTDRFCTAPGLGCWLRGGGAVG